MIQVSGLQLLLSVGVILVVNAFLVGAIFIGVRNRVVQAVLQKAFVTPTTSELNGRKVIDLERDHDGRVSDYSYDTRRISERSLRRQY